MLIYLNRAQNYYIFNESPNFNEQKSPTPHHVTSRITLIYIILIWINRILFDNLTPEVTRYIGYVNPTSIALPYKLREANLSILLHLLYHLEQLTVVSLRARNDVSRTAEKVMTILDAPNERVQFLAAVTAAHHNGLSPRFADRV